MSVRPDELVCAPTVAGPGRRRMDFLVRHEDALILGVFVVLGIVTATTLLWLGRDTNFYKDEWFIVLGRRGISADTLLQPHNEHLAVIPILGYKTMLQVFGWGDFLPYRIVGVAVHLVACGMLFAVVRRFVSPATALLLVAPILLLGKAWNGLLAPFQAALAASMAVGLGALLTLDRRTRRGDAIACGLLLVSIACSGLGVAWAIAVAVDVLLRPGRLRRSWVFGVPLALYAIWALAYPPRNEGIEPTLGVAVEFIFQAAAAVAGAYTGLGNPFGASGDAFGPALLVGGTIMAGVAIARLGGVPIRTVAIVAAAAAFWFGAGLRRDVADAGASRYLLPGAFFMVAAVAPLLPSGRPRPAALAAGAAAALMAVVMGWPSLTNGADFLREDTRATSARLAAIELVRDRVDPMYEFDPTRLPRIFAFQYLPAEHDFRGSPATPLADLPSEPVSAREQFDQALIGALRIAPRPPAGKVSGSPPALDAGAATATTTTGCVALRRGPLEFAARPGGLRVRAPRSGAATVRLSRLAPEAQGPWSTQVPADTTADIALPRDALSRPWTAAVDGPARTLACQLAG